MEITLKECLNALNNIELHLCDHGINNPQISKDIETIYNVLLQAHDSRELI